LDVQAVRCNDGSCEGWLLEQRQDNLSEGATWRCSSCARTAAAHSVDGQSGPGDITDAFRVFWNQALAAIRFKVHLCARLQMYRTFYPCFLHPFRLGNGIEELLITLQLARATI
jgi:hypothetical protein